MMFSLGDDNLVAGLESIAICAGPAAAERSVPDRGGNHVDALGRIAREYNLVGGSADKFSNPLARSLKGVGCLFRELVCAAVHCGVSFLVKIHLGVNDNLRFLGRGGGI